MIWSKRWAKPPSRLQRCEAFNGRAHAFRERPIEGDWQCLWIDATHVSVRRNGLMVSVEAIIAVGVNSDGRREMLGMAIGPSEVEPFWTTSLRKLTRRGLRGVKFIISNAREGIKAAVSRLLCATWQRCRVQLLPLRDVPSAYVQRTGPIRQERPVRGVRVHRRRLCPEKHPRGPVSHPVSLPTRCARKCQSSPP